MVSEPYIRPKNRQEKMMGAHQVIRLSSDSVWKAPIKQGETQSAKLLSITESKENNRPLKEKI